MNAMCQRLKSASAAIVLRGKSDGARARLSESVFVEVVMCAS